MFVSTRILFLVPVCVAFKSPSNCSTSTQRSHALEKVLADGWPSFDSRSAQKESAEFWKDVRGLTTVKVFNAGFGTTGTRFIHEAVARHDVPAIHNTYVHGPKHLQHVTDTFDKVQKTFIMCMKGNWTDCDEKNTLILRVRTALRDVLTSGAVFLSDYPYTDYIAEILTAIPDLIIIQTRRDPLDWAFRRTEFMSRVVICNENTIKFHRGTPSYFDWLSCAESSSWGVTTIPFPIDPADQLILAAAYAAHQDYVTHLAGDRLKLNICVWDDDAKHQRDVVSHIFDDLKQSSSVVPV